jgi:hypothetical protein
MGCVLTVPAHYVPFTELLVGCPWSSYKSTSAVADADSINTGSVLAFSGLAPGRIPDARAEAVVDLVGAGYDWLGQVGAMASSTFFHLSVSRTTRE